MLPSIDFESELAAVDAIAVAAELRLKSSSLLSAVGESLPFTTTTAVSSRDGLLGLMSSTNSLRAMTNASRADLTHAARVARAAALSDLAASLYATAVRSSDTEMYTSGIGVRNDAHAASRSLGAMLKGWGTAVTGTEPAFVFFIFWFC